MNSRPLVIAKGLAKEFPARSGWFGRAGAAGEVREVVREVVKVIENPLAKAEPLVLKVKDIADRKKSKVSMMPKGLLDKLTKEEILDLIAYVRSGANAKDKFFSGGHDHGHGH